MSSTLIASAAVRSSLRVLAIRDRSRVASSSPWPRDERHHRHARLESRETERESGEQQRRDRDHHQRIRLLREQVRLPVGDRRRMLPQPHQLVADDDHVQREIGVDEHDRKPDRLAKASEEDRAERREQHQRDEQLVVHPGRRVRVAQDVLGRVGRRERDGDDEVGRRKSEQARGRTPCRAIAAGVLRGPRGCPGRSGSSRRCGCRPAARRRASRARARASRAARGSRRPETRCWADTRAWRSSRRR